MVQQDGRSTHESNLSAGTQIRRAGSALPSATVSSETQATHTRDTRVFQKSRHAVRGIQLRIHIPM